MVEFSSRVKASSDDPLANIDISTASYETLKVLACLHSQFERVMLLDPHAIPTKSLEHMFDMKEMLSNHAILWSANTKTSEGSPITKILPNYPAAQWEQDSSIVMINRSFKHKVLFLALHFASDVYVHMMGGDNSIRLACIALDAGCALNPKQPNPIGMMDDSEQMCGHSKIHYGHAGETQFIVIPFSSRDETFDIDFKSMQNPSVSAAKSVKLISNGVLNRDWDPRPHCLKLVPADPTESGRYQEFVTSLRSGQDAFAERLLTAWNLIARAVCNCSEKFAVPAVPTRKRPAA